MKKINVLQVVEALDLGGSGKNVQTTVKYFDKNIFNVSVCVLVPRGQGKKRSKNGNKTLENQTLSRFLLVSM